MSLSTAYMSRPTSGYLQSVALQMQSTLPLAMLSARGVCLTCSSCYFSHAIPGENLTAACLTTDTVMQAFIDSTPQQLQQVVSTNMTGTLLCTRAAMQVMQKQDGGGHIFNMDGAGADGMPTPQYAAYGATKAGAYCTNSSILQLCA